MNVHKSMSSIRGHCMGELVHALIACQVGFLWGAWEHIRHYSSRLKPNLELFTSRIIGIFRIRQIYNILLKYAW